MYFTQVYGSFLFITWMPTYLHESRGFSSIQLGVLAGLPLTLSAVADVLGGFTTDALTKRFGLRVGRCAVGGGSLTLAGLFMISGTFVANPIAAAVLLFLAWRPPPPTSCSGRRGPPVSTSPARRRGWSGPRCTPPGRLAGS